VVTTAKPSAFCHIHLYGTLSYIIFLILNSLDFSKQNMPVHIYIYTVYVYIIISFFVSFYWLPAQFISMAKRSRDLLTFIRLNNHNVLQETAPNYNFKKQYEKSNIRIIKNIKVYDYPINKYRSYLILRYTTQTCHCFFGSYARAENFLMKSGFSLINVLLYTYFFYYILDRL
jgi:hypothetical protein